MHIIAAFLTLALSVSAAPAAELSVLSTGATRSVVQAIASSFEKATGHRTVVASDTAGGVARRVAGGERFDVVIGTPAVFRDLAASGLIAAPPRSFAITGIGVGVREGVTPPDVSTVDAFKAALLASRLGVAYADPAAGGTSGVYVDGLLRRLGIADALADRIRLKRGGFAAELVATGEADIVVHQISEIIPVTGVRLVGPLPAEIQLTTTFQAAPHVNSRDPAAVEAFIVALTAPDAALVLRGAGMEPPRR